MWRNIRVAVESLPLTVVPRRLAIASRNTLAGGIVGTAHADTTDVYADPQKINAVVQRYF